MPIQKITHTFLIWLVGSIVFVAGMLLAGWPSSIFTPSGDAAFGFGLAMIPYDIACIVVFLAISARYLYLSYLSVRPIKDRMKFYALRYLWFGLAMGAGYSLFALGVYRRILHH